jgi:uncharacterized protein YecT (DUF1311 family)
MKTTLPLLLALWSTSSFALDCKNAVTTPDINECAAAGQKQIEAKLNQTYQGVLKSLDDDKETKKALVAAQRAWVKFREADCKAVYQRSSGGTIRTVMYIGCMQNRAETRIKELEDYTQPN